MGTDPADATPRAWPNICPSNDPQDILEEPLWLFEYNLKLTDPDKNDILSSCSVLEPHKMI